MKTFLSLMAVTSGVFLFEIFYRSRVFPLAVAVSMASVVASNHIANQSWTFYVAPIVNSPGKTLHMNNPRNHLQCLCVYSNIWTRGNVASNEINIRRWQWARNQVGKAV